MATEAAPNTVLVKLDTCTRVNVFRGVEKVLRNDDMLANVVDIWQTWEGNPNDKAQAPGVPVILSLWPSDGGSEWYSPDLLREWLTLNIAVDVETLCVDDALNAWTAVERAIMPANEGDRETIRQTLWKLGCTTGLPEFMPPTFISSQAAGASGRLAAIGQIKLEINLFFTPQT